MNLLTILLLVSCNKDCSYCTIKKWKKPLDYVYAVTEEEKAAEKKRYGDELGYPVPMKANMITNETLLKWLDKFIDPKEWYIEITGGEPGLYKNIDELVATLNERGYKGIIRTNGTLPILQSKNFHRVAAWHSKLEEPPEYYDMMLIMKDDQLHWMDKAAYCKKNNIPFKCINKNDGGISVGSETGKIKGIKCFAYMNSVGQLTPCSPKPVEEDKHIFNMSPPRILKKICPTCINVEGFEWAYEYISKMRQG